MSTTNATQAKDREMTNPSTLEDNKRIGRHQSLISTEWSMFYRLS